MLVDRTGSKRVATTDPSTHTIYLSSDLSGDFLERVLTHELTHAAMHSFGMLTRLHQMVQPIFWIEIEEWICNLLANQGDYIYEIKKEMIEKWKH